MDWMELPPIECPRCGEQAARVGVKPYCRNCGWNVASLEAALHESKKPIDWKSVAGILITVVTMAEAGWVVAVIYAISFFGMLALFRWYGHRDLRKILADLPREFELVRQRKRPDGAFLEPFRMVVESMPRPRPVRIRRNAWVYVAAILTLMVLCVYSAAPARGFNFDFLEQRGTFGLLFILHALAVYVYLFWRTFREAWREIGIRRLLTDGDVGIGRVVSQEGVAHAWFAASTISFEFRDRAGRIFQGKSPDISGKLFEEMFVPVFYDPLEPDRNVPLCSTYQEIVLPAPAGGQLNKGQEAEGNLLAELRGWLSGGRAGS